MCVHVVGVGLRKVHVFAFARIDHAQMLSHSRGRGCISPSLIDRYTKVKKKTKNICLIKDSFGSPPDPVRDTSIPPDKEFCPSL